jgi:HD-like signal output (HDOD) protein
MKPDAKSEEGRPDLNRILSAGQLPALPQSAIRLLQLSKDLDNGPAEFAVLIEADPGLTSQILRFVNSSYFGFKCEVTSIKQAILLVGVRIIKNFALWSAVFSLTSNSQCGTFSLESLWQDSIRRGLFARLLARMMGASDIEEPFVGALLQDMALPLLIKAFPDVYSRLLKARQGGARLSDLEQEEFGWTHGGVAGEVARRWNLPDSTTHLIERHSSVEEVVRAPKATPAEWAVTLSALLPSVVDEGWIECRQLQDLYDGLGRPDAPDLVEVLAQIDRDLEDLAPAMKLVPPRRSLVECYLDAFAILS